MVARIWTHNFTNCTFTGSTNQLITSAATRRGTFNFTDCVFAAPAAGCVNGLTALSAGSLASTVGYTISLTFTRPTLSQSRNGTSFGIQQDCSVAPNGTVNFVVDGATGTVETTATANAAAAVYLRCPGSVIKNSQNLIVKAPSNASAESFGLYIFPNAANLSAPQITENQVYFNAPAGHGISLGNSTTVATGTLTGGIVRGNVVRSNYYASATPHNITLGRATTGAATGNISKDSYIGILASRTTTADVRNNTIRDCYGAGLYAKGCTASTFTANNVYHSAKFVQRSLGCLSVDSQSGTNTVATTMSNNLVVVGVPLAGIPATFSSLVNITANQSCTYSGNTYIIPDDVPDSTVLFYVGGAEGGRSGATGYTITQWLSGTAGSIPTANGTGTISVSGETVIKLPISVINQLISGGAASSGLLNDKVCS
jgi:hypothetical protein